jgi:dehydrogenase/reductase SDR family member 12
MSYTIDRNMQSCIFVWYAIVSKSVPKSVGVNEQHRWIVSLHAFLTVHLVFALYRTGYTRHVQEYKDPVQSCASLTLDADGSDGVDWTDKVVMITGANSGIGYQMATYAAAKGARVYIMCRNPDRAEKARQEIMQATNGQVNVLLADVAELSQVRKAVQEFQDRESRLDVLVCNAGVLLDDKKMTSEGNEVTFASHLLGGSYLLSQLLIPQLEAVPGRVIFVTSGGMYTCPLPLWNILTWSDPIEIFDGVKAYAYAKRGQVILAERQSRIYPRIMWLTAHPGWTDTPAVDDAFGDTKSWLQPLREPWQGAEGMTWLMGADKSKLENGGLYLDRKIQPKHLAGPLFSAGKYTTNKPKEVDAFIENLKKAAGL